MAQVLLRPCDLLPLLLCPHSSHSSSLVLLWPAGLSAVRRHSRHTPSLWNSVPSDPSAWNASFQIAPWLPPSPPQVSAQMWPLQEAFPDYCPSKSHPLTFCPLVLLICLQTAYLHLTLRETSCRLLMCEPECEHRRARGLSVFSTAISQVPNAYLLSGWGLDGADAGGH